MPAALEFISNHPLYGIGAALLIAFLVLSFVKKLVGLGLIVVAGLIGYSYYLQVRGEEERPLMQKVLNGLDDAAERAAEKAREAAEKAKEAAKEALEKK